jgi:archaellum component FlaC
MEQNQDRILPECKALYEANEKNMKEAKDDVSNLYKIVDGIPQEIKAMKENITRLCDTMERLMDRLESNYVSKQTYDSMREAYDLKFEALKEKNSSELSSFKDNANKDIQELKDNNKWVMRGVITSLAILLGDLFKGMFSKVFGGG